jgi:RimK-like ATP-grasp domain
VILLWGLPTEEPMAIVRRELDRLGADVVFLDQQAVLQTDVELEVDSCARGSVRLGSQEWQLRDFAAVYARAYDSVRVASVAGTEAQSNPRQHAARVDELLWAWCDLAAGTIVNRPRAMSSNDSKPYQADLIRQFGFATPDTLITTDPDAVCAFWDEHQSVIYKSVSGVRSIVSRLGPGHAARLDTVTHCPTQFQAYVPGVDVRVHVVGSEVLACELVCAADDYRYRGEQPIDVRPCALPDDVAERCVRMTACLDLSVAGIDLRRTPDARWYCFEVNPMPGFSYFEHASGLPIGAAIARLLASAA